MFGNHCLLQLIYEVFSHCDTSRQAGTDKAGNSPADIYQMTV